MRSSEELSKLAFVDDLTGLYNRRWLFKFLREELGGGGKAVRSEDPLKLPLFSLLMVDLDGFKTINDTRGHLQGDRVLVRFTALLKDGFAREHYLARYAGDEFTVLMPQTGKAEALVLAEQFRKTIEAADLGDSPGISSLRMTVSIGVATFPEDAATLEELVQKADRALYFSKLSGKNCVSDAATIGDTAVFVQDLIRRFPCPRLVGREREIEVMKNVVESCRQGRNMFVLVRGEPGVGKTRFLAELVRIAEKNRFISLLERCAPEETAAVYRPLINLLDRYLLFAPEELKRLSVRLFDEHIAALKSAVPAFKQVELRRQTPVGIAPERRRQLLFEALVNALCALSESMPLTILLDEFHNADIGTIEIVKHLLGLTRGHVLVCGAVSSTAMEDEKWNQGPLAGFLSTIRSTDEFRLINLDPLTAQQVNEMIAAIFPDRREDSAFDGRLFELSKGNPLYVEEILKFLINTGQLTRELGTWRFPDAASLTLPQSLQTVVESSINTLDKDTCRMVTTAAVIGPNFGMDVLKAVAGWTESETLEFVDHARKKGIIVSVTPLSDEQLRFASEHVRNITYKYTDNKLRTELHDKIGKVEEELHGDNLPSFASRIAFHYRLAGNREKTMEYERIAKEAAEEMFRVEETPKYHERQKSILRNLIREADRPLEDAAMAAVGPFLRNLSAAVRTLRMYPPGSRPILTAQQQLATSLQKIMGTTDVLTFVESKEGLVVNTVTVEPKGFGGAAGEMLELLKSRYIKSITFTKEHTQQELEKIVSGLSLSTDKGSSDPEYWNRYLDEHGVCNIALRQKAYYVSSERVSDRTRQYKRAAEIPLDQQTMLLMRDVLRYFSATVENIALYPPGSQLITFAFDLLIKSFAEIFKRVQIFTFSIVEDSLLINGVLANPQILGNPVMSFMAILGKHKIRSCTIAHGVKREELEVFLVRLAGAATEETRTNEFWDRLFEENDVVNIAVGHKLYAAVEAPAALDGTPPLLSPTEKMEEEVSSSTMLSPPLSPSAPRETERASERALKEARARAIAELEELLTDEGRKKTLELVETLLLDSRTEEAAAVAGRIAQGFLQAQTAIRVRTAEFFAAVLEKASPMTLSFFAKVISDPLVDALRVECNLTAYTKLASLATVLAGMSLEKRNFMDASRLITAILKQREGDTTFSEELRTCASKLLVRLAEGAATDYAFAALSSDDPHVRESAAAVVYGLGDAVVGRLVRLVKETDDYSVARFAAATLHRIAPQAARDLVKELSPLMPVTEARRVTRVLEQLSTSVELDVIAALRHPEGDVRKEGLNVIRRMDSDKALRVMMQALDEDDPNMVVSALTYFGEQKRREAALEIAKLIERNKDDRVRKAACIALGKIADERTIPLLCKIIEHRPATTRLLGLGSSYSEEVRAAAAWALGSFAENETVRAALERAAQDRSAAVRSAVKLSLQRQ